MTIKQQIEQDLKQAMLQGDKDLATTLRGLKSVILNVEIAEGRREEGLGDNEVVSLLQKEAKKRQESADLYIQGAKNERAEAELAEKKTIEQYLPTQLSAEELDTVVSNVVEATGASDIKDMGRVIGEVKKRVGSQADGGRIAVAVKARLNA